jgi:hypothetical protein
VKGWESLCDLLAWLTHWESRGEKEEEDEEGRL